MLVSGNALLGRELTAEVAESAELRELTLKFLRVLSCD